MVRDFSERHERDDKLRRTRARIRPLPVESTIAGIVSGEFDRFPKPTMRFLNWSAITARICKPGACTGPTSRHPNTWLSTNWPTKRLRFGACTPFEKELIRKDGTRFRF